MYIYHVSVCLCTEGCHREEQQVPTSALAEEWVHEDVKKVHLAEHHRKRVHHRHGQRGEGQVAALKQ